MEKLKPFDIIIYHKSDLDGVCSAAVALKYSPEATLFPLDYDEMDNFNYSQFKGKRVIMLDISFNHFDNNVVLAKDAEYLLIVEHHKAFIDDLDSYGGEVNFDFYVDHQGRYAACELAWKYLFPHENLPHGISLLSAYDSWNLSRHENTLSYQFGMRVIDDVMNPKSPVWGVVLDGSTEMILNTSGMGEVVLRYQKTYNEGVLKRYGFIGKFDKSFKAACVNVPVPNSHIFAALPHKKDYDLFVCFTYNGKDFLVTLYPGHSGKVKDVSVIAKSFGGGGHRGAAGFTTSFLPVTREESIAF